MGRVMRGHPDKEFAVWLDHSGNYLRFRDDWDEVYEDGIKQLDEKIEKAKREPTEKTKKESKCSQCGHLWPRHADICPSCGHVRQRRNHVEAVAGQLHELVQNGRSIRDEKQKFYSELIYIANEKNYKSGWVSHKYREKFGVWPKNLMEVPILPSSKTRSWIRHKNIVWSKRIVP
jgi:DNA repair protein RadD